MNTIRRAAPVAILFGALFVAGIAQAGDVKGKVSAVGIEVSGKHCCLYRCRSGQEIRSARAACIG